MTSLDSILLDSDADTIKSSCDICTICQDELFDGNEGAVRVFRCGHRFHWKCIRSGDPLPACPNCREEKIGTLCEKCFVTIDMAYVVGERVYALCPSCIISKFKAKLDYRKHIIFRLNRAIIQLQHQLSIYDESVEVGSLTHREAYAMFKNEISKYFNFTDRLLTTLL